MKNKLKYFLINSPLVILGGILGAVGGQGHKEIRRIGIPLLITVCAYLKLHNLFTLSILFMVFSLSIGYGVPSWDDPKPSILGNFFYNLTKQNNFWTNFCTRGTVGLLISLTLISIPLIKSNWVIYILSSLGIILTQALLSWRGFGEIKMFGENLLVVDILIYSAITLFSLIIIYY